MILTDSKEYPLREAFRIFYPEYMAEHTEISKEKRKAAECIMRCKTGELGYNVSYCEKCGHVSVHAVSCNNRSCSCCQQPLEKKWESERNTELIEGIAYYHVVFTVPHELNQLFRHNLKSMLDLLFNCVKETLLTLCADRRFMGAKPGIISVLHTWGQRLTFHPHIHVCISGGGITPTGQFVETRHKGFFIPEAVMSKMFRGKFLCGLKELYGNNELNLFGMDHLANPARWQTFIDSLFEKKWIPFVKETFNGKGNAIKYLARYSFRTAIANSRIIYVDSEHVSFKYKDYADGNREKIMKVKGTDFIGMFLQHIMPSRFHRVRFSGYLTNNMKTKNLKLIHRLRNTVYNGNPYRSMNMAELMLALFNRDICSCPMCSGTMVRLPRGIPLSKVPLPLDDIPMAMR